jgi:hypothetical protein
MQRLFVRLTLVLTAVANHHLRAAEPASPQPSHLLNLRFDAGRRVVAIAGSWRLPPQQEEAKEWRFLLSPKMSLPTLALTCAGRPLPVSAMTSTIKNGDREWRIETVRPCLKGERAVISFRYETREQAPQLRVTADSGFAGGGGELWYPQTAFSQRDTSVITLNLPDGLVGIATGTLVHHRTSGSRTVTTFRNEVPAKLAFAFGPYREAARSKPFPMRVLTRHDPAAAEEIMGRLATLLPTLEEAFGAPPYRSLALVEVAFEGRVLGTSEYGMIFADPSRMSGSFDAAYWAHEFGHQWWGNAVRAQGGTAGASLLTEGMAQYGALLAIEAASGPAEAARLRRQDKKDSIEAYCRLVAAGKDRALTRAAATPDEALEMHRLVTSKGAVLLYQLSQMIGRERFHRILRAFVAQHFGEAVGWQDLEDSINRGTNGGYGWWFDQWLKRPGAPNFTANARVDGSRATITIAQKPPFYRLVTSVELAGSWGRRRARVEADGAETTVVEDAPGPITSVMIDPDASIPNCPRGG